MPKARDEEADMNRRQEIKGFVVILAVLVLTTAYAAEVRYESSDGSSVPAQVGAGYTELTVETGEAARVTLAMLHEGADASAFEAAMAAVNAGIAGQGDFGSAARTVLGIADLVLELEAAPSGPTTVGAELEPGRYAVEYLPMGEQGPAGPPVYTYFQATGSGDPAPSPDAVVDLVDFAFAFPSDLAAGTQTWQVVNSGQQIHHMVLFRLNEGATADEFMAWLRSEQGPPPGQQAGYVGVFGPGQTVYQTVELAAGTYVAICFIPDHAEGGAGAPHFVHGMIQAFQVGN